MKKALLPILIIIIAVLVMIPMFNASAERNKILGDVDGDGTVTVNDVTALQMYLAEYFDPTPEQLAAADVNRDAKVNIRDVTQLQRFLAEFVSL